MTEESGSSKPGELAQLQQRLAGLDERPVNEHPDVLEAVHSRLAADLDGLVIPRAEAAGAGS